MKSAICVINKSYIAEDIIMLIDHYLNYCYFDYVFLYDNCTTCIDVPSFFKKNAKVRVITVTDDEIKNKLQQGIYTECLITAKAEHFDYVFFVDNDELLWINKNKYLNINSFLTEIQNKSILHYSIPWRFISYNSLYRPFNRSVNFKSECLYILNYEPPICTVKSFVSPLLNESFEHTHLLAKTKNSNFNYYTQFSINVNPETAQSYFDFTKCDLILYHYYMKSWLEWNIKLKSYTIDRPNAKTYKDIYDETYINACNKMFESYTIKLNPFNI